MITREEITRALGEAKASGGFVGEGTLAITNASIASSKISASEIAGVQVGATKLNDWRNPMQSTSSTTTNIRSGLIDNVEVDFDEAVWSIEVPGVERDKIEVFTVGDIIYVDIDDGQPTKQRKRFLLADGESLDSVVLELGVLRITIDRPVKRVDVAVK